MRSAHEAKILDAAAFFAHADSFAGGMHHERKRWVTAFTAYQKALSEPYFDQDDESRQSNRNEVQRCFDRLKQLAEE